MRVSFFIVLTLVILANGLVVAGDIDNPSNKTVDKQVDDIVDSPKYRWIKDGSQNREKTAGKDSVENINTKGFDKNKQRYVSDDEGCGYDQTFGEKPITTESTSDDSCGNDKIGDCGCSPDGMGCSWMPSLNGCGCGPVGAQIGNLGALGQLFGYIIVAILIVLLVFFVVKAILDSRDKNQKMQNGTMLDPEEAGRISQVAIFSHERYLEQAKFSAENGDYKKAVGFCYLAAISRLARAGFVELDKSTTNRNIVRWTKKNDGPYLLVEELMVHFEDLFFGQLKPEKSRYERCLEIVELGMKDVVEINGEDINE